MAHYGTPAITKYMRRLLDQYSQLIGKSKDSGSMKFWDAVVLTAADAAQQKAYQLQIEEKISRKEIPTDLPIHVVSDPPQVKVGNGGSTLVCLEFLEKEYGNEMFKMKILLIHAGGWSQRMPSATVLGKVFTVLPHGTPPFQMLDLKLALYWPFVPRMGVGIFLVCADDFVIFNLGEDDSWSIPKKGFTALAHPSSIAVGRTHGVFVLCQDESMDTSKHVELLQCVEVLQKPNDDRMKSRGALLKGSTHTFADGICLDGEIVYTDSCFYFGADVMEKLLNFKKSLGDLKCEIDAYGDFLQALGKNSTCDYVHNTSNVSQATENLIEMRKQVFNLLNGCDIHVLALNASAFIHIGTTKELIHHLCRDLDFQDQLAFDREVFNLWYGQTPPDKNDNSVHGIKTDIQKVKRNPDKISEFTCVIHSSLRKESTIENDCLLEYCDFEVPVHISANCIISNCQIIQSEAQIDRLNIPANTFLHTVSLHEEGNTLVYVTLFFRIDDNLKKAVSLKDVESLPFLGSDIGYYLGQRRLNVEDITPNDDSLDQRNVDAKETNGKDSQSFLLTKKVSLWTLKLYPASESMTASIENAVSALSTNDNPKLPRLSQNLYSLNDVIKMKSIKAMLSFRKNLYEKIKETL